MTDDSAWKGKKQRREPKTTISARLPTRLVDQVDAIVEAGNSTRTAAIEAKMEEFVTENTPSSVLD